MLTGLEKQDGHTTLVSTCIRGKRGAFWR